MVLFKGSSFIEHTDSPRWALAKDNHKHKRYVESERARDRGHLICVQNEQSVQIGTILFRVNRVPRRGTVNS